MGVAGSPGGVGDAASVQAAQQVAAQQAQHGVVGLLRALAALPGAEGPVQLLPTACMHQGWKLGLGSGVWGLGLRPSGLRAVRHLPELLADLQGLSLHCLHVPVPRALRGRCAQLTVERPRLSPGCRMRSMLKLLGGTSQRAQHC